MAMSQCRSSGGSLAEIEGKGKAASRQFVFGCGTVGETQSEAGDPAGARLDGVQCRGYRTIVAEDRKWSPRWQSRAGTRKDIDRAGVPRLTGARRSRSKL